MSSDAVQLFAIFGIGAALTLVVGFYCILTTKSLLRALVGVEVLTKGVTLLIISTGYVSGRVALAQALVITLIVVEVAVIVVAVSIVLCLFRHEDEVDAKTLRNLKG